MDWESLSDLESCRGHVVVDPSGAEIGEIQDLYLDGFTRRPLWAGLGVDQPDESTRLVPLIGAEFEGGVVRVAFDRQNVLDAPVDDAAEVRQHYVSLGDPGIKAMGPPDDYP